MNEVLPRAQTRISAPMCCRDQPSRGPSRPNSSHAPKKVSHIAATGNHSSRSNFSGGISSSTSAGSATLITHQLMPGTMPTGSLAWRATSTPSSRHTNSINSALIRIASCT